MNEIFFTYQKDRDYDINAFLIFVSSLIVLGAILWFFTYRQNNTSSTNSYYQSQTQVAAPKVTDTALSKY